MRGWILLGLIVVLLVVLPVISLTGVFGDLVRLVGQIVLTLVLIGLIAATGAFGYICIRAQAAKWGTGLLVISILFLLAIFWVWTGKVLLVI
ncbi:MAG: hypothetical protein QW567_01070 [Candidatus Hadarchaeales archaeon]